MPSSSHLQVSDILEWVVQLRPERVLDVGVGTGKYGFLCREALDNPMSTVPRKMTLHGIEGYPDYIGPLQRLVYDEIAIGNCLDVLERNTNRYDLALFIDVIEHFEKEDGYRVLERLLEVSRNVIVATPYGFAPQDDIFGNPLEIHRSGWVSRDFARYPSRIVRRVEHKLLCFVGKDALLVRRRVRKGKLLRMMRENRAVSLAFSAAKASGLTDVRAVRERLGLK